MLTAIFCLIFYICHRNHPESIVSSLIELTLFMVGVVIDLVLEAIGLVYILVALGLV